MNLPAKPLARRSLLCVVALAALPSAACHGDRAEGVERNARPSADSAAWPAVAPSTTTDGPAVAAPIRGLTDVADLVDRVKPVVVSITATQKASPDSGFELFFGPFGSQGRRPDRVGLGSGFVIDPNGYVVTNEHVIHGASEVRVHLLDGREVEGNVVGRDPKLDVALIKLPGVSGLPAARLGSSQALRVGEPVIAVGNPFGLGFTVTTGIVSAKERALGLGPYDDFIQTDASINPGNSGGPLFDARGEIVGINSAIRAGANGIGFAIPIDAVKQILPQLKEKGHVERGRLGVAIQDLSPDLAKGLGLPAPRGALVAEVEQDGPAARAGLRPGDVIIGVAGQQVQHSEELPRIVASHPPGSSVAVTFLRGAQQQTLTVQLAALRDEAEAGGDEPSTPRDRSSPAGKLGLSVSTAPGGGARIEAVAPDAAAHGFEPGDVIVEVAGARVNTADDLRGAIAKAKPGTVVLVRIRRRDSSRYMALPIPGKG